MTWEVMMLEIKDFRVKIIIALLLLFFIVQIVYSHLRITIVHGPGEIDEPGYRYGYIEYYSPFDPEKPSREELEAQGFVKGLDGVYRKE